MLGPSTQVIISLRPIRGLSKTSSGVGKSVSGSGGRLTPIWSESAADTAGPRSATSVAIDVPS